MHADMYVFKLCGVAIHNRAHGVAIKVQYLSSAKFVCQTVLRLSIMRVNSEKAIRLLIRLRNLFNKFV